MPSPKFHCQPVGLPVEESVNCTIWPAVGEVGANVKEEVSSGETVRFRVAVLDPELLKTVSVTVLLPGLVYVWVGFWEVLPDPSPKFHCQEVGDPEEVSVN